MKKILILVLCFSMTSVVAQQQILKGLKEGLKYEIYIRKSSNVILKEGEKPEQIIIKDPATVSNLIKKWKGKKTFSYFKCGYNCFVSFVYNGKVVEELSINDECGQVINSNDEAFDFTKNPFKSLTSNDTFSSFVFRSNSKSEVITFIKSIKKLKDVFCWDYDSIIASESGPYEVLVFGNKEMIKKLSNSR